MRSRNLIAGFTLVLSFLIISCSNNQEPTPGSDAMMLEFSIQELPDAEFSIDQNTGIISINNFSDDEFSFDKSALTAEFETSSGASVKIGEGTQESGNSVTSFERGVFYTVISEDQTSQTEYFVHLEENLPLSYFLSEDPEITLNPSGIAPLSAALDLNPRQAISANLSVEGDIPVSKSFEVTGESSLPVLGLYANTTNTVNLTLSGSNGLTAEGSFQIETEPIPDFFPEIEINTIQESAMEPGLHFSELHIGNAGKFNSYPVIFDNNEDIRWYIDLSELETITWPIQFNNDHTFFAINGVTIFEYDMLGRKLNQVIVDYNNMHHEIIKLPNGNYVIAVWRDNTPFLDDEGIERDSIEDMIIEVDPQSGEIITEWDMAEILDVDRVDLVDPNNGDWFHMNAIWYDESDNSLIVSGRNQGLVKVNWDNELQWILAPHKGWGKAGRSGEGSETSPFLLTAIDASENPYPEDVQEGTTQINDFSWAWGQHAPMLLPNGNLFVFDNGTNRNFGNASLHSKAIEYKIDEENMTIQQVWSYGKQRGGETYSSIISDVDYLTETGNRIFAPGFITGTQNKSKIIEVSYPGKNVVFESTFTFKNQLSAGSGWGNIDISYRAERVRLYNDEATTIESAGKILSQW